MKRWRHVPGFAMAVKLDRSVMCASSGRCSERLACASAACVGTRGQCEAPKAKTHQRQGILTGDVGLLTGDVGRGPELRCPWGLHCSHIAVLASVWACKRRGSRDLQSLQDASAFEGERGCTGDEATPDLQQIVPLVQELVDRVALHPEDEGQGRRRLRQGARPEAQIGGHWLGRGLAGVARRRIVAELRDSHMSCSVVHVPKEGRAVRVLQRLLQPVAKQKHCRDHEAPCEHLRSPRSGS